MNISYSIKLPFISSSPLKDIYWMIVLFPLWWILGVEQFIYPLVLGLSTIKTINKNKDIRVDKIVLFFILFLIVYCISVFYIANTQRLLTFVRNFGAYFSATLLLFIFSNEKLDQRYVDRMINAIILVMVIAGFVGLLGIIGVYRGRFTSVIGNFLPSFITNTTYGGLIASRSIGVNQWFVIFGEYFRVSSLFLFSTFFASTVAITFPLFWYKYRVQRIKRNQVIITLFAMIMALNLLFTTGRAAIASLTTGILFIFLFHPEDRSRYKRLLIFGTSSLICLVLVVTFYWTELELLFEAVIYARGGGSASSRLAVYKATLAGFLERPIFGWGTEQDVSGLLYPAGSHSNYLGILYKQGAIGFLLMVAIYLLSWIKISNNKSNHPTLSRAIKGVFIIILLNGMTDVLDLDASTFIIAWTILGIGIYGNNLQKIFLKRNG